ncbi:MAG: hypothetical protein JWM05_2096, partial [Acidimicrobiales bacterium]|nr:hypothetical protein [Acidimicrobiales bacterium]
RLAPVVRLLARRVEVRAVARCSRPPDAVLAIGAGALDRAPAGVPTAVWIDDAADLDRPEVRAARVAVTDDPAAEAAGAVLVPRDGVDLMLLPPVALLTRVRWRERYSFDARLVVGIDATADPGGDAPTALALAAAAVVHGPLVATALALGTPVVTSSVDAARLGLRDRVEVLVVDREADAARTARDLAADEATAAALAGRARAFAEAHLDLSRPLLRLLADMGLVPDGDPAGRLDARLDELVAPSDAAIRRRAAAAIDLLTAPPRS